MNSTDKNCLIVVNEMSGNSRIVDLPKVERMFGKGYNVTSLRLTDENASWNADGYDRIVVCGGDGTLNAAINRCKDSGAELYYCPFGTLNERSKDSGYGKNTFALTNSGTLNDSLFTYVAATGIFTPLGYIVNSEAKHRFKILAYISKVWSQYQISNFHASVHTDSESFDGNYTLFMAIDSKRCFGLSFNHLYKLDDKVMHLLLIRSPGANNLRNKIKLFFPLFRAFFIGFRRPCKNKNVTFVPFTKLSVDFDEPQRFCVDGEEVFAEKHIDIGQKIMNPSVTIVPRKLVKK